MNHEFGRILLIEDDPHDVELIQMALESQVFASQIDVVRDGEQALHYLLYEDQSPTNRNLLRLVLLDLKLPRVSGLQVLQAIRADPRTRNLVVVVLTSSEEDADLNACYDLGVNSYIVKPVDFQQFLDMAHRVGTYWMLLNKPSVSIT